jgi:RND family efflux transporter MFP subunit
MLSDTATRYAVPRRKLILVTVAGVVIAVTAVVAGVALRIVDARNLRSWTDIQAIPAVEVVKPAAIPSGPTLDLPSRLEAFSRAPIFARVNGYLKSWSVDIGTPVKAGQFLAEIETPELDQQLLQARADLVTAQANYDLSATTAKRWQALVDTDSVSRQEVDDRLGDFAAKKATVTAARANVERLVAMKGFQRIVAPFDGVITSRNTDVGALINAGSGGAGQQLFTVSYVKQLRLYVQVPQNYTPLIRVGTTATLTVPEHAGEKFTARVIASAESVDVNSGTTLVQLLVDNSEGRLLPGGYASLRFSLPVDANAVQVPATALVFDRRGLMVATLTADNHIAFKQVTISRDLGDVVDIGSGLSATDRVIDTPPDGLANGDAVRVAPPASGANAATAATAAPRAASGPGRVTPPRSPNHG